MKTLYESILDDEDEKMDSMGSEIENNILTQADKDFKEWTKSGLKNYRLLQRRFENGVVYYDLKGKGVLEQIDIYSNIPSSFSLGIVNGDVWIDDEDVDSLQGCPICVTGAFNVWNNKKIKNLKGSPKVVGTNFSCQYSPIQSLEGSPEQVGGDFNANNTDIKDLKGITQKIGMCLRLKYCKKLKSLKGIPSVLPFGIDLTGTIKNIKLSELKNTKTPRLYVSEDDGITQEDLDKAVGVGQIKLMIK